MHGSRTRVESIGHLPDGSGSRDADPLPTLVMYCSRDERDLLPAIVARFDAEGELKSASRSRASEGAREGTITDAKLTVSGGMQTAQQP